MTREQKQTIVANDGGGFPRALWRAAWWTTMVWISIILAAFLMRLLLGPQWLAEMGVMTTDSLIIAVVSLLIAYASMVPALLVPGLLGRRACERGQADRADMVSQSQTGQLVAGVMIRLLGTVALFMTCRYQMAIPTEVVASLTIGWYIVLTAVDVSVFAQALRASTCVGPHQTVLGRPESQRPTVEA